MTQPRPGGGEPPRLFATLTRDVGEIAADIRRRGIRREMSATLATVETFYLDEDARQRLASMKFGRRTIRRFFWLVRSLLLKLTPARRVLLALALVLLVTTFEVTSGQLRVGLELPGLAAVLVLIVLMLELKDKVIARSELVAGRAVQLALTPPESPDVPGWDVWLYTRPANDVGGDLVDHVPVDDRHRGIALGDVAGKALPAALLMVKLQATLRALVPQFPALDALGAGVNRILHRDGLPNRFATLIYLVLAADSGRVRYLNAGHLPPLVVRGTALEELRSGSMALGFVADATFEEHTVDLGEGELLVAFSDGVVEAMNATDDFFGDERLRAAISSATGQSAEGVGHAILDSLDAFVGETRPYDDISVVVIRRRRTN